MDLDAIVLATHASSRVRVAGLTARERALRVATRVGATRVLVVDDAAQLRDLTAWRGGRTVPLLVVRADQFVHLPLVAPLVAALPGEGVVLAVVPENPPATDLPVGSYAGAFIASGAAATTVLADLAGGVADDNAIAAKFPDATRIPHGRVARAPLETREQVKAAQDLLYEILIKAQDNAITNVLFRPVSLRMTRVLVWTPITPNMVSYTVAVCVAIGCWFTAHASFKSALLGTVIVLLGSYFDCCDGEIARVKLMSSKIGAWIDTIVDELSSISYMIAIGWHCHLHFGLSWGWVRAVHEQIGVSPWKAAIVLTVGLMLWCIYCIYYNIIVAVGSANSQDYVGRFEVVPGTQPGHVKLAPAAAKAIVTAKPLPWPLEVAATYLPYIVRRDFISWLAVILAATHLTFVAFGMFVVGALISFFILTIDHVKLRALRRSIARQGMLLEAP